MENPTFGQKVKQTTMKFLKRLFLFALVIGIAIMSFFYWGVYERGVWAGKVLSVSEKGILFKTHEGKISMESFGALKGTSPIAETRDFSVEKSEQEVLKALEAAALKGERVNLHFVKRYMRFPWRGDTKYFVVRVEVREE
jgi:hypothetical protein